MSQGELMPRAGWPEKRRQQPAFLKGSGVNLFLGRTPTPYLGFLRFWMVRVSQVGLASR